MPPWDAWCCSSHFMTMRENMADMLRMAGQKHGRPSWVFGDISELPPELVSPETSSLWIYLKMYESPRAVITKYHKLGGLHNKNLFPHNSRGYKSEIKVSARLVAFEAVGTSVLGPSPTSGGHWPSWACGHMAPISLSIVMWPSPVCVVYVQMTPPSFIRTPGTMG